ncbi:Alpha/Beta hydrolase protein [Hypoxylon cercidicola]|nr:Alpha/Beta hydrolase protein [Hypoxylon cercidicola]
MAETNNPLAQSSDSSPEVSRVTLTIAGLKVDIYGLSELPAAADKVSCLWLHHPRLRVKEDMAGFANLVLSAYHHRGPSSRGLIAVAFDQRNHGSRLVDDMANESWRDGNKTHAQDMFGTISGAVTDNIHLLDALEGYLFGAGDGPGALPGSSKRHIDHNMVLGVSLGGHSAWQLLFAEPRVTAGVMVIGCPDFMHLLGDRARLSKLETFSAQDNGVSFFGSKDFPKALIEACKKYDPKGILFGTGSISSLPVSAADQERLRPLLDSRIAGKRFQVLSGGADKLVPYRASEPFLSFLKDSVATWYKEGGSYVEDNVYPDVGHAFNDAMRSDAVRFLLDSVALVDSDKQDTPKI